MRHLPTFDEFLGEGMYDKRWPHWMRFDYDQIEDTSIVHYGFMRVGNIDTEKDFFAFLKETGIKFKRNGINSIKMSHDMADRLQISVKPRINERMKMLFESDNTLNESSNAHFNRVIPRDLFNESKLLKSMGRLCLLIHDQNTPVDMKYEHDGNPFKIALTDAGNLHVSNIVIYIKDQQYDFHTTYNSKDIYPLYVMDEEYVEYEVFDDKGEFTTEFVEFSENIKNNDEAP